MPGIKAGERLAEDGILKVVCINHEVGNISLDERCNGINDGLEAGRRHVGGGGGVAGSGGCPRRVEAYLTAHPDMQAVFATGCRRGQPADQMFDEQGAVGQIQALHLRHRAGDARSRSPTARWASAWTRSST